MHNFHLKVKLRAFLSSNTNKEERILIALQCLGSVVMSESDGKAVKNTELVEINLQLEGLDHFRLS